MENPRNAEMPVDLHDRLMSLAADEENIWDVVRRLLALPRPAEWGALQPLVESGAVAEGDRLVLNRPRVGQRFTATVAETGVMVMEDGTRYITPTAAYKQVTQHPANGWRYWRHEPTGRTLLDLRDNFS